MICCVMDKWEREDRYDDMLSSGEEREEIYMMICYVLERVREDICDTMLYRGESERKKERQNQKYLYYSTGDKLWHVISKVCVV